MSGTHREREIEEKQDVLDRGGAQTHFDGLSVRRVGFSNSRPRHKHAHARSLARKRTRRPVGGRDDGSGRKTVFV